MRSRLAALAALALGAAGCNTWYNDVPSPDDLMHVVPWFDHMLESAAIHPYETADVPRATPAGTVPLGVTEPEFRAEWVTGNTTTADALVAPPTSAWAFARGDTLYGIFCATCHGERGAGDGLVGRRVGAPSLLTDRALALSDGYLYAIVRYGRGVMGKYGDKIWRPEDRWAVVQYTRHLQGAASGRME